ncbi:hypothetical protein YC2023_045272 [Brassica napus]
MLVFYLSLGVDSIKKSPGQGSPQASPRKVQNSSNDCISPNGFQALQDIREEGEIEHDEKTEEVEVPDSASLIVESLPVVVVTNETSVTAQRHGGCQRNKGRGAKRGIVNSRDLVQAVTQQQKANSQGLTQDLVVDSDENLQKASYRSRKVMLALLWRGRVLEMRSQKSDGDASERLLTNGASHPILCFRTVSRLLL